jgi:GTP-binding protein EngB required for normal cell division
LYLQDCRRDFSTDDFDFIESLRNAAEVWLVLTKTDKLNQKELHKRKVYFEGQPFASKFFVSSLKTGKYDWRKLQSKLNQTADQKAAEPFPQSTP